MAALMLACMLLGAALAPVGLGASRALMTDAATVGANSFATASCFSGGGAFVGDQASSVALRGKRYHAELTITVRYDGDGDCMPEADDAVLPSAEVSMELRDGQGALVGTAVGTTDAAGLFTTKPFKNLSPGTYAAAVVGIIHASAVWDPALDVANPVMFDVP